MLDGPLVFVDVDTQRDFMEPEGALYVPGAAEIVGNLARLTAFARARGIPILATACAHTADEADPEPFPPHCLVGTPGQERADATRVAGSHVVEVGGAFEPDAGLPGHVTIHKQRYDVFSHPEAERIVARYAASDPTFVVYGVATDYCVKAAVEGLRARGCRVAVVVDAIRAIHPGAEAALLTGWAREGVRLVRTQVVCGEAGA